ncbi:MAG: prolyl oligopeptidase family serine peptidase [Melioribacteraceae bacterium]|nr:prolyl oligopeptidase family serine peptidase [Melioribacteraceae bacterium]
MSENYSYKTSEDDVITITTYGNDDLSSRNCLIYIHGFKGFKDWGFVPYIGEYFANKGFFVITFNFSHNGIGENKLEFTKLDKFAANTFSREITELKEVVKAYKKGFYGEVSQNKIGFIGHSRGGAIAILTANQLNDISSVAVWSSVSYLDRYSERQKEKWREKGVFEVLNTRTNQVMSLNISLLDDLEKNKETNLNIEKAVSELDRPLLIAHGDQDLAVKVDEAEQLYNWSRKDKTELFVLHSTGHTFDCKHPFEGTNEKFEKLLSKTEQFFQYNLN